jgi:hypothetical protein
MFLLATDNGRHARAYVTGYLPCYRDNVNRTADRILDNEMRIRDRMRVAAMVQHRRMFLSQQQQQTGNVNAMRNGQNGGGILREEDPTAPLALKTRIYKKAIPLSVDTGTLDDDNKDHTNSDSGSEVGPDPHLSPPRKKEENTASTPSTQATNESMDNTYNTHHSSPSSFGFDENDDIEADMAHANSREDDKDSDETDDDGNIDNNNDSNSLSHLDDVPLDDNNENDNDNMLTPSPPLTTLSVPAVSRDIISMDDLDEDEVVCTICLGVVEDGERVGELTCNHIFHADCLKDWLRRRNVCPLCQTQNVATRRVRRRRHDDDAIIIEQQQADNANATAMENYESRVWLRHNTSAGMTVNFMTPEELVQLEGNVIGFAGGGTGVGGGGALPVDGNGAEQGRNGNGTNNNRNSRSRNNRSSTNDNRMGRHRQHRHNNFTNGRSNRSQQSSARRMTSVTDAADAVAEGLASLRMIPNSMSSSIHNMTNNSNTSNNNTNINTADNENGTRPSTRARGEEHPVNTDGTAAGVPQLQPQLQPPAPPQPQMQDLNANVNVMDPRVRTYRTRGPQDESRVVYRLDRNGFSPTNAASSGSRSSGGEQSQQQQFQSQGDGGSGNTDVLSFPWNLVPSSLQTNTSSTNTNNRFTHMLTGHNNNTRSNNNINSTNGSSSGVETNAVDGDGTTRADEGQAQAQEGDAETGNAGVSAPAGNTNTSSSSPAITITTTTTVVPPSNEIAGANHDASLSS